MKKLSFEEIEKINKNMIAKETEKAYQIKVNFVRLDVEERDIFLWVPKSCTKKTECGLLDIKDWFLKIKENELHGYISPILNY